MLFTPNTCSIHFSSSYPQPPLESRNLVSYSLNACSSVSDGPGSMLGRGNSNMSKTHSFPLRSSCSVEGEEKHKHTCNLVD